MVLFGLETTQLFLANYKDLFGKLSQQEFQAWALAELIFQDTMAHQLQTYTFRCISLVFSTHFLGVIVKLITNCETHGFKIH